VSYHKARFRGVDPASRTVTIESDELDEEGAPWAVPGPAAASKPAAQPAAGAAAAAPSVKPAGLLPEHPASAAAPPRHRRTSLPYDLLVMGVGARNNTFGIAGVEQHTHFLKELADARAIRSHIIRNVESATFPGVSAAERRRLLSIVVVGE
jgi:NADH dehydrogenase FAD-containing subunit